MKDQKALRSVKLLALFLAAATLYSCLPNPEAPIPKQFNLKFKANNVDVKLGDPQDTLKVEEFKLLMDNLNLYTPGGDSLQLNLPAVIMAYDTSNAQADADERVLEGPIGAADFTDFNGTEIFIDKAERTDNIFDDDFMRGTETFSFVIHGTFNGNDFSYQSKVKFNERFDFETVKLTEDRETLVLRFIVDVLDVVIDRQTRELLDPRDSQDAATIDSLLEISMFVDAFSAQAIPFN